MKWLRLIASRNKDRRARRDAFEVSLTAVVENGLAACRCKLCRREARTLFWVLLAMNVTGALLLIEALVFMLARDDSTTVVEFIAFTVAGWYGFTIWYASRELFKDLKAWKDAASRILGPVVITTRVIGELT